MSASASNSHGGGARRETRSKVTAYVDLINEMASMIVRDELESALQCAKPTASATNYNSHGETFVHEHKIAVEREAADRAERERARKDHLKKRLREISGLTSDDDVKALRDAVREVISTLKERPVPDASAASAAETADKELTLIRLCLLDSAQKTFVGQSHEGQDTVLSLQLQNLALEAEVRHAEPQSTQAESADLKQLNELFDKLDV